MSENLLFAIAYAAALLMLGGLGVHIATIVFGIAVSGLLLSFGPRLILPLTDLAWTSANDYVMVAMPLFILLGELLLRAGITERMYGALAVWMSRIPGRLLHSNIAATTIFAATSGSSVATAATIGTVALPALNERGYSIPLSLGSLAAGGTLGILIPPSINLIIYGVMTDTSIGRLFIAGLVPGLLLSLTFSLTILVCALVRPQVAPAAPGDHLPFRGRLRLLPALIPPLLIIIAIIGSIYTGLATPTEASALGLVASLTLAACYRRLSVPILHSAFRSTVRTTGLIMLIMMAALFMNFAVGLLGIPQQISQWVRSLGLSGIEVLWILLGIYIVLGCFLEGLSMMIMTIPIVAPLAFGLGIDPVWFGVFIVLVVELALITPPVGLNLFVVQAIRKDGGSFVDVVVGAAPFVVALILFIILTMYVPDIVLWLPDRM